NDGELIQLVPCFASDPFDEHRRKQSDSADTGHCSWQSHTSRGGVFTTRNSNTVGSANDAVCFEVKGDRNTQIEIEFECHAGNSIVSTSVDWSVANHRGTVSKAVTLGELLDGRVAIPMQKPSTWIVTHRAHSRRRVSVADGFTLRDGRFGYAYLRVTQTNGQMAWSSPVFVGQES
ncbi:MAG: hypothetical protein VX910_11550, partial [Candidatus Latescibacterota bacterium]|nr:hypothetical protein [Candidatus Latescibacterota bacterium]